MSVHYVPAKRPPTPDILGDVLGGKVGPEEVEIESIQTNGGTQMRAGLNAETVGEYIQTLKDSDQTWPFPPVTVFFDGEVYWLGDGFHRVAAVRQLGRTGTIPCEVRAGDRRAAVLYAAGANANHGLRRTNQDKRRAVETLLRDAEWAQWSNREIARQCNVSESSVRNVRDELERTAQIAQSTTRIGADGRVQNVTNIGTNQPKYQAVWELERIVARVQREHDALPEIMRAGAQHGIGSFWGECQRQAKAAGEFRLNDLRQAINNVAHQVEVKANPPTSDTLDPWAVAIQQPGSRQIRSDALARAIMPWIQEYRDAYGRNWQDLALHGNPAHTNSTFWGDIGKECKRRAVTVDDDTLKLAIKQAFAWLLADAPAKTQAAPTPYTGITAHTWEGYTDWTADDDAEYAALAPIWQQPAGSFNSITESRRITRWRVAARLASERRDNIAFSLQETARHLRNAERLAAQLPASPPPVFSPVPSVVSMPAALLKGSLRRWLGERYAEQEDPTWFMYQMLDDWMHQDELHHLEAFTATLPAGWTQDALDQAIRELHEHFAPDSDEQDAPPVPDTDRPVIGLADLVVVDSVTAPALDIPLPNFAAGRQPDPEPESDLDNYDDESASLAAKRMNKLHTLKVRFAETIELLEAFGELTGRHTASLLAKRELTNLIEILNSEMDALQKEAGHVAMA